MMEEIAKKLDLSDFLGSFSEFFARPKPFHLEGDAHHHIKFIKELDSTEFTPPLSVPNLDGALLHLKKYGVLKLDEIFSFIQMIRYFRYLKTVQEEGLLKDWADSIQYPEPILEIIAHFDSKGSIKPGVIPDLDSILAALDHNKRHIQESLSRLIHSPKITPYLVDRQIHLQNGEECLLVRGGFNHILKASVIGRSGTGFFYVFPENIAKLKTKESELLSQKEELLYRYCQEWSTVLNKQFLFLRFVNKEFDRFDHYQARVLFAKGSNLEFLIPSSGGQQIRLSGFRHPALTHPKPLDVTFDESLLMVTGVNAGGKTMLMKSLLSASYLARQLIPMPVRADKSSIGTFKEIIPIIEDPQNVKNDISTFAGRMRAFGDLFGKKNLLVGVDEIELGTDSDEAASLFKAILENLISKGFKIIITTHHKRLAALMAGHSNVQLLAALYDEEKQSPTYTFLSGTIGKSYAFETAERYGIPNTLVREARKIYGEDKERLNELIEKSSLLEREMQKKTNRLDHEIQQAESLKKRLEDERESQENTHKQLMKELESSYQEAIQTAKNAAKESDESAIRRQINIAQQQKPTAPSTPKPVPEELKVGDRVKHQKTKGTLIALSSKDATIETDEGFKLVVPKNSIKKSGVPSQSVKSKRNKNVRVDIQRPHTAQVKLDLHGLRSEEAVEKLDQFLSNALLAGFDEVLVYHGIGTGKLAYAVKEFLITHPKVLSFDDAPPQLGGFGAKIIRL